MSHFRIKKGKTERSVRNCLFLISGKHCSCLTYTVTVCKAKDAFNLIKRHMLLDLYHISVEFRGCTVKGKLK